MIVCANCGAQTLYDASQISGCCPSCGSTSVMPAAENEQIMAPGAVIPFAIDKYPNSSIKEVNAFYFDKLVPYSPEYLAGIPAERYTVGLNDAWRRATAQIADKLKNQIGHYELERQAGDTIDNVLLSTNYYNVKFRYLLAPMYLASYRYGKKVYQVAINGQTGTAYCDTPSNRWIPKLILGIALSIVVTLYIISIIIRLSF